MIKLEVLDCSNKAIKSLASLANLKRLRELMCTQTRISSLAALALITTLEKLECCGSAVASLDPIAGPNALRELDCSSCALQSIPLSLLRKPTLKQLVLVDATIPGVPAHTLSDGEWTNCLDDLRNHYGIA